MLIGPIQTGKSVTERKMQLNWERNCCVKETDGFLGKRTAIACKSSVKHSGWKGIARRVSSHWRRSSQAAFHCPAGTRITRAARERRWKDFSNPFRYYSRHHWFRPRRIYLNYKHHSVTFVILFFFSEGSCGFWVFRVCSRNGRR